MGREKASARGQRQTSTPEREASDSTTWTSNAFLAELLAAITPRENDRPVVVTPEECEGVKLTTDGPDPELSPEAEEAVIRSLLTRVIWPGRP